ERFGLRALPDAPRGRRSSLCDLRARRARASRRRCGGRGQIARCDRCGAALTYSAEAQGSRCAFCGSVTRLEQPADPLETAAEFLPFRVPLQTAHAALGGWLRSRGFFRPSDLASAARLENLRPLFWCAWLFDADALVSWTADSDAGSGRSPW